VSLTKKRGGAGCARPSLGHDLAEPSCRLARRCEKVTKGAGDEARPVGYHAGAFAEVGATSAAQVALEPASQFIGKSAEIRLVGRSASQTLLERGKVKRGQNVIFDASTH
jgi:NADPH:quinone reductase-like Zn-dependent oxidoreductase